MTDQHRGEEAAGHAYKTPIGGDFSIPRRPNKTGRSDGRPASSKQRQALRAPKNETFVQLPSDVLESHAFKVMCGTPAARALWRIVMEHDRHGRVKNGHLIVTYNDLRDFGLDGKRISSAVAQLVALGLIVQTDRGRRAWGEDKGSPAMYEITWFPVLGPNGSVTPPRHGWERHATLEQAKAAFERAGKGKAPATQPKANPAKLRLASSAA